jgi:hypothetical protein
MLNLLSSPELGAKSATHREQEELVVIVLLISGNNLN